MRRDAPVLGALCALIAVLAALGLSACGGDSDTSTSGGGGEAGAVQQEAGGRPSAEEEVESAGREAEGSEAAAILTAKRDYLNAIADKDYAKACSLISEGALKSLEASISKPAGSVDCDAILSKVLGATAADAARSQAGGEVRKVRVLGDQALVIFHAPGARLYVFSLVDEGGEWKAATLVSTVLAPSAATLGGVE
jgi:hypothetical protein